MRTRKALKRGEAIWRGMVRCLHATLAFAVIAGSAWAQDTEVRVTGIRAYADGTMHLYFSEDISAACGSILRVTGDNIHGRENVRTVALAAMVSGQPVRVDATAERSGNFCNLVYIRLDY